MVLRESESELQAGDRALAFELPGVDTADPEGSLTAGDAETHSLESFADSEAMLVVFTCNHCPYAQAKFDLLNDLAAYDDVSVVGINPNDVAEYPEDSAEKMEEYVADGKVAYDAYLRDESQDVAAAYGAECTPDPFLFENRAAPRAAEESSGDEPRDGEDEFRLAYHGRLDDAPNPDDDPSRFHVREAIDAVLASEDVDLEWQPSRGCSIKWKDD